MIRDLGPVWQALLGTLLTWGLTAAGAAVVVLFTGIQQKLLDCSLGFAAGVMLAASYWSLLEPALEMAESSKLYGDNGEYSFIPVSFGFLLGALFVFGTDILISSMDMKSPFSMMIDLSSSVPKKNGEYLQFNASSKRGEVIKRESWNDETVSGLSDVISHPMVLSRRKTGHSSHFHSDNLWAEKIGNTNDVEGFLIKEGQWKRIVLLIVAVTIHNIPEGLAVGVGFGAIGNSPSATFESARNLAIGIGIQNFPEGLAVSLPLRTAGFSVWRSFWYGQLSGMVEPVFGVVGAAAVYVAQPLLPYALAFAAGAMVYVVVDDILPEAHSSGNGKLASWGAMAGFVIMMVLDVGLG